MAWSEAEGALPLIEYAFQSFCTRVAAQEEQSSVRPVTLEGVGFGGWVVEGALLDPDQVRLKVGYSTLIHVSIPASVGVLEGRVDGSSALFCFGHDACAVGSFLDRVRCVKPASVYKRRGIGTPSEWARPRKVVKK